MKKRIAVLLLAALTALTVVGCGSEKKETEKQTEKQTEAATTEAATTEAATTEAATTEAATTEAATTEAATTEATTEETTTEAATEEDVLAGKLIGVQLGTTGDLYITDDYGDDNVERYNKGFEAVQALMQGKIDAVVIDELPAQEFVKATEGLKILEAAYAEEEYAICFKKDNNELTEKVNGAIAELKENGVFDQIINSYIGDNAGQNFYESPADTDRSNGTLVMATNAEFPPYEYHEGDEIVGLDVDFAQAICDVLGMELEIEDIAFDSIIPAVVSGKADMGVAGMTITEERLQEVNFSDPYVQSKQVIIVKADAE